MLSKEFTPPHPLPVKFARFQENETWEVEWRVSQVPYIPSEQLILELPCILVRDRGWPMLLVRVSLCPGHVMTLPCIACLEWACGLGP